MVTFIFAHELGHIALQHNIAQGANKQWEARADEWACQQLCKMKATVGQAKLGLLTFVPADRGSVSNYPNKGERITAVEHYFAKNDCGQNKEKKENVFKKTWNDVKNNKTHMNINVNGKKGLFNISK